MLDTPSQALCPSCGASSSKTLGAIPDAVEFAGSPVAALPGGQLWDCPKCSLWFRSPRLSKARLDELYDTGSADAWETPDEARVDWVLARQSLAGQSGTILDLGCYDGRFLEGLEGNWKRFGIEVNRAAAAEAQRRDVTIVGHDFAALDRQSDAFDVITAFDVFEHVEDPKLLLEACARALAPGGRLIVATGNTQSFPFRLLRARNAYCICAEHLVFLSPRWAEIAAPKAGLKMDQVIRYRRAAGGQLKRAADAAKNIVFVIMPWLISGLRRLRGNVDHEAKMAYPLLWPTAKDHFLIQFSREAE